MDASLIAAPFLASRYETQFGRTLPSDCRCYFRAETWSFAPERNHRISDGHANRDDHLHQEPPAIRSRKNVLDEQILGSIANAAIRKREV
jgi:hypothetical protein